MSALSGPRLERLVEEVKLWYAEKRQELINALQEDYPYGAAKLAPAEQFSRFLEASAVDYETMILGLNDRYRGLPDSYDRVNHDLADYFSHMITLMITGGQG